MCFHAYSGYLYPLMELRLDPDSRIHLSPAHSNQPVCPREDAKRAGPKLHPSDPIRNSNRGPQALDATLDGAPGVAWVARYSLHAADPPHEQLTIRLAEAFRRALMSRVVGRSPVFAGRSDGLPLARGHRHAFFLPEANGGGVLTHMTIYARDGFGLDEQRALAGLRKIFKPGQGGDLRVLLETVTCLENHAGPLAQGLYGTLGPTRRWTSATPFCPTRHSKPRPGKRLENQVRIWLDGLGLPSPSAVRIEDRQAYAHSPRGTAWSRFQRLRKGEPEPILARGVSRCLGVELEFPEPVAGPIAIGHQCHFGLGRFEPRSS